ncbi:hypothetical protein ACFW2V_12665 [Streptomyces sp. NPDC058947]|uniref:hypothetical protein n=1 Tax=Streptomyces sp. NPDC058947 TaxID=3346675 RepID=UPI00368FC6D8
MASACDSDGGPYEYGISGTVQAWQVDYECGDSLAMEPAAFTDGKGKGGGSSSRKQGGGYDSSDTGEALQGSTPKPLTKNTSTPSAPRMSKTPPTARPTASPTKAVKGVKLTEKPDRPVRITKVPSPTYTTKPRGCETEYELFIQNDSGLFEQEVRRVDYNHCSKRGHKFPACTSS